MPVETTLHTEPIGGGEPIAELPAEIITYGYRLNRPGPVKFRLSLDHELTTRANVGDETEAVVTRNGAVVWRGPIWTVDEQDQKEERYVEFEGLSLEAYLFGMHVTSTLEYSQVDQFDILRGLVDHHQGKPGGDFGIDTSQDTLSGVLRDRTYHGYELKNIADAAVQLAEVENGFDFDIDPATRALRCHYPKRGSRKPDLIWDERTIRTFGRTIDKTAQASRILGVGAGEADDQLRFSLTDSGALAAFGLTEAVYANLEVSQAATLEAQVRRQLRQRRAPAEAFAITVGTAEPPIFSYQLGDEGQLRWDSPYDPVGKFMRLVGFDITWNQGVEEAVLYLQDVNV